MAASSSAEGLIQELLLDPAKFDRDKRASLLLQKYFDGLSIETLRPILRNENALVRQTAGFIASELGSKAAPILDDVIPLLDSTDSWSQAFAMDVVAVCATGPKFLHLFRMLESELQANRTQAMILIASADASRIEAAEQVRETHPDSVPEGLRAVASLDARGIEAMLEGSNPLTRRYGAIAAYRIRGAQPALIEAARRLEDPDIRRFLERMARREMLLSER